MQSPRRLGSYSTFVTSVAQLYVIRFLLGVSESPFFAGIIIYLNHWFLEKERAKATTFFMFGFPLSGLIVSPISGCPCP